MGYFDELDGSVGHFCKFSFSTFLFSSGFGLETLALSCMSIIGTVLCLCEISEIRTRSMWCGALSFCCVLFGFANRLRFRHRNLTNLHCRSRRILQSNIIGRLTLIYRRCVRTQHYSTRSKNGTESTVLTTRLSAAFVLFCL